MTGSDEAAGYIKTHYQHLGSYAGDLTPSICVAWRETASATPAALVSMTLAPSSSENRTGRPRIGVALTFESRTIVSTPFPNRFGEGVSARTTISRSQLVSKGADPRSPYHRETTFQLTASGRFESRLVVTCSLSCVTCCTCWRR